MSKEWVKRILFAIIGLAFLGSSIELIQTITWATKDNIQDYVFVHYWFSQIVVLFFALGWFTIHWLEVVLLEKQMKTARVLFWAVLLEGILSGACFHFFVNYEVLNRFGITVPSLIFSGAFLRYSVFSNEAFTVQRNMLHGEKNEPSG
jgi:hypothetical protein